MKLKHSVILMMMAILVVLPITALATPERAIPIIGKGAYLNTISSVSATVSGVKVGNKASDCKLTIPSDADYTATLEICGPLTNGVPTMNENATFEAGKKYRLLVTITPMNGYTMASSVEASINGEKAEYVVIKTEPRMYIDVTVEDSSSETTNGSTIITYNLTEVAYTVEEPVDGIIRKAATNVAGNITGDETATLWYKNDKEHRIGIDDRFEDGNSYIVEIHFNVPSGYVLGTKTGKINGHTCTIEKSDSGNFAYVMEYQFDNLLKATEVEDKTDQNGSEEVTEPKWSNASDWAKPELEKASADNLIPDMLNGKDFTSNITRREFAATCVKLYEKLSGKKGEKATTNPFTDTDDAEVLKAYNLGITNGTSETTFSPEELITREQMATMMTRALNKSGIDTTINVNAVYNKFADHDEISTWALDSVYFMSARGVIKGVGENKFNVRGNATREQALAISTRSVAEFKK